jgi:L-seryl-tRNA(Ser) seleniumtransferase
MSDLYRQLPKVDAILADPRLSELPHGVVVAVARQVLDQVRRGIGAGEVKQIPDVYGAVRRAAVQLLTGRMRRVINATGVVVHTNLGRAPWPDEAVDAAVQATRGYCNLEIDLESGKRGGRIAGVEALLCHLTGAEAGLIVNNCAAAVLLALTTLARDKDVVVSRGQLVEIGGSFRVPDVISAGGARLVEVGTTNRTRIEDFAAGIGPETAVLLRVHPSNFRISGFTEDTPREALVSLAAERGLKVVEDLGSGLIQDHADAWSLRSAVAAGVDVVLCSGDKLLGGPQAGIAVGRADVVKRMRQNALYRALRADKVTIAATEATLALHAAGKSTPVERMRNAVPADIGVRAKHLADDLVSRGVDARLEEDVSYVGGGAMPDEALDTVAVVVDCASPHKVAAELRASNPPIVARVMDATLRLDVRTLTDDELIEVGVGLATVLDKGY